MNIEEIRQLAALLNENNLTSLEVTGDGKTIKLEKKHPIVGSHTEEKLSRTDIRLSVNDQDYAPQKPCQAGDEIVSPIVGVFYAAASPESAPFVTEGGQVKKGDVLCIIEAMKLMNEITADRDGVVTQVCAQNGQVVEFGQVLFKMR